MLFMMWVGSIGGICEGHSWRRQELADVIKWQPALMRPINDLEDMKEIAKYRRGYEGQVS